jgi:dissimilatory sulfite reductase (desulfoviridin) alpha/beta subunit
MKWTKEAEKAVSRAPFFVRKRVKKRVEEEAERLGADTVTLEHVQSCQKKFLGNMEKEVKGYQVETCFGESGCPNRAVIEEGLVQDLEELLASKNIRSFLQERVKGPLKMHHEFRVSISDCPNACSRPQIVDMGFLGARRPELSDEPCTRCGSCVEICREGAITLADNAEKPSVDLEKCVSCGQCLTVCPSGTLQEAERGYRILVGGKLGRHPQLAKELEGVYSRAEVLKVVEQCLHHYFEHNKEGERFGEILNRIGLDER